MKRARRIQSHWISFLFLIPFLLMLWLHHHLELSDAMMAAHDQRDRSSVLFNLTMVLVFFSGVATFTMHSLLFTRREPKWLAIKLIVLVVYWTAIVVFS